MTRYWGGGRGGHKTLIILKILGSMCPPATLLRRPCLSNPFEVCGASQPVSSINCVHTRDASATRKAGKYAQLLLFLACVCACITSFHTCFHCTCVCVCANAPRTLCSILTSLSRCSFFRGLASTLVTCSSPLASETLLTEAKSTSQENLVSYYPLKVIKKRRVS